MAGPKAYNRVQETAANPAAGTVTLAGAARACQTFASKHSDGDRPNVMIEGKTGNLWEAGRHTYTAGTITRSAGDVEDGSSGPGVLTTFTTAVDVWQNEPASVFNSVLF